MLIQIDKLKGLYPKFNEFNNDVLEMKLASIESAIRAYSNNNFQKRAYRDYFTSNEDILVGNTNLFKVGDTLQISENDLNKGLYVVLQVHETYLKVDKQLMEGKNLVTKVEYPLDVIDGAIKILEWDMFNSDKGDIASETISRHSVSYHKYDGSNTISGYPSRLFGFLKGYLRARV